MSKNISKQTLQIGTAIIWGVVLIGASILTESEGNRALDWELMWVIVGGFLAQNILMNFYLNKKKIKKTTKVCGRRLEPA